MYINSWLAVESSLENDFGQVAGSSLSLAAPLQTPRVNVHVQCFHLAGIAGQTTRAGQSVYFYVHDLACFRVGR